MDFGTISVHDKGVICVTSTKLNPFGPAVSERSLPEFKKETAGHEPNQERQFSTS